MKRLTRWVNKSERRVRFVRVTNRWGEALYLAIFPFYVGALSTANDHGWWVLVYPAYAIMLTRLNLDRRKRKATRERQAAKPQLDLDKPDPNATASITIEQGLLIDKIMDKKCDTKYTALLDLWKSLYGREPDYSRPVKEIMDEVVVALNAGSS